MMISPSQVMRGARLPLLLLFLGTLVTIIYLWPSFLIGDGGQGVVIIGQCNHTQYQDHPQFSNVIDSVPWDVLHKNAKDPEASRPLIPPVLDALLPYLVMEPRVPINSTCNPPPLETYTCPAGIPKLGEASVPKVAILIQLGFDVDTLEIHLREVYDLVDKFFIAESTRTHLLATRKPLIWERIKTQPRFLPFLDKVVHIVLDGSDNAKLEKSFGIWKSELHQESIRWSKFLKWNMVTGYFSGNDLLGFGDADEIVSRQTLWKLKNCDLRLQDPIDIGTWFPFGNISQATKSDWPIKGLKYTYGDPTYHRFGKANASFYETMMKNVSNPSVPTRNRGKSPSYLLGGIHMTHHGYLPFQITKRITVTDTSKDDMIQSIEAVMRCQGVPGKECVRGLELKFAKPKEAFANRLVALETIMKDPKERMKEVAIIPWFYDCNRGRYPTWEGHHDTRLD